MATQPNRVSFRFEDNGRFHDDLVLELGDRQWRCDSYYLLIDSGMAADREDASKVRDVLRRLVEQWRSTVIALADADVCYLPYDFSDEYTGWLRCEAAGHNLKIRRGWAEVEGYSFNPSEVGELLKRVPEFHPDDDEITIPRDAFLCALDCTLSDSPPQGGHKGT